jgi:hypothetical protein
MLLFNSILLPAVFDNVPPETLQPVLIGQVTVSSTVTAHAVMVVSSMSSIMATLKYNLIGFGFIFLIF